MSFKAEYIEAGIRHFGGVQSLDFTAASGARGNTKVDLDVVKKHPLFMRLINRELARLAGPYHPDLIVPIPTGADIFGIEVARRLETGCALLEWEDKTPGQKTLRPRTEKDLAMIVEASRIVFVDDVFSTDSSIQAVHDMPDISFKAEGAVVIWDRSDGSFADKMPIPVDSIVHSYVPFLAGVK